MQSVHIATIVVSSNPANGEVYSIQHYISHITLIVYIYMLNDIFTAILSCTIQPCQNHGQCQSHFCACTPNYAGHYCESMYYYKIYLKKTLSELYMDNV